MSAQQTQAELQIERYNRCIAQSKVQLFRHQEPTLAEQFKQLQSQAAEYESPDYYGSGELIESFEQEIAALFGKEAALFMPSGTMAQAMALRIVADRKQNTQFAIHPSSHLELHEQMAYQQLWQLKSVLVGDAERPVQLSDLKTLKCDVSSVLLELPMREIGGQLPVWEDLEAQSQWARENAISFHLDGARIWSCPHVYNKSLAEIAELFDLIYVSFYKDMAGISGAMLIADSASTDTAKIWRRRCGGDLIHHYPAILSAKQGMAKHLPAMESYVNTAKTIADCFARHDCFELLPKKPQANLFHLVINRPKSEVVELLARYYDESGIIVLPPPRNSEVDFCRFEITIGDNAMTKDNAFWQQAIDNLAQLFQSQ